MKEKKVLLLCTVDSGGAGTATVKLLTGLLECNYTAVLLVKTKTSFNNNIIQYNYHTKKKRFYKRFFDKLLTYFLKPKIIATDGDYYFYSPFEKKNYLNPQSILEQIEFKPDIIISTWTAGFLNFKTLAKLSSFSIAKVYIWMLDMGSITGGCHYAWQCKGYIHNCENCPAIMNLKQKKLAKNNLLEKKKWIDLGNIFAFGGSAFTQKQISSSYLFIDHNLKITFSGLIDQNIFNPINRTKAREKIGLSKDKKIIFAGAINPTEKRKGFDELKRTIVLLERYLDVTTINNTVLILVGEQSKYINSELEIIRLPFIQDEKLFSLYYQAADVFLCPSIEDSGPQMTLQALACGTPVVAFDIGFGYDIVKSGYNGFSVPVENLHQFTISIKCLLELNADEFQTISENAVKTIDGISSLAALENLIKKL